MVCPASCLVCVVGGCSECVSGYGIVAGTCEEICGDGMLFVLECDDGNMVDGDGCSKECRI
jgi:cysteine-rich repeat protein